MHAEDFAYRIRIAEDAFTLAGNTRYAEECESVADFLKADARASRNVGYEERYFAYGERTGLTENAGLEELFQSILALA